MLRIVPSDRIQAKSSGDEEDEEMEKVQFKVILLGDGAVGKTSIAMRFAEDQFSQTYKQTVGVDFHIRRINIPPRYQAAIQLWDIGGQSIGSRMVSNYVSGAHVRPNIHSSQLHIYSCINSTRVCMITTGGTTMLRYYELRQLREP